MTEYARTSWAEGSGANISEPSSARKLDGYPTSGRLPAGEFNWLLREAFRGGRSFANVQDGIEALAEGEVFSVDPRDFKPFSEVDSATGDFGVLIECDGLRVYTVGWGANANIVTAYDPRDFSVLWTYDCTLPVLCMDYAHGFLFVSLDCTEGDSGILKIDAPTGIVTAVYEWPADISPASGLAANSVGVYFITGDDYYVRSLAFSDLADGSRYNYGAALHSIACNEDGVWVTGADQPATSYNIVRLSLAMVLQAGAGYTNPTWAQCLEGEGNVYAIVRGGNGLSYRYGQLMLESIWDYGHDRELDPSQASLACYESGQIIAVLGGAGRKLSLVDGRDGVVTGMYLNTTDLLDAVASDGNLIYAVGETSLGVRFLKSYTLATKPRIFGRTNDTKLARAL